MQLQNILVGRPQMKFTHELSILRKKVLFYIKIPIYGLVAPGVIALIGWTVFPLLNDKQRAYFIIISVVATLIAFCVIKPTEILIWKKFKKLSIEFDNKEEITEEDILSYQTLIKYIPLKAAIAATLVWIIPAASLILGISQMGSTSISLYTMVVLGGLIGGTIGFGVYFIDNTLFLRHFLRLLPNNKEQFVKPTKVAILIIVFFIAAVLLFSFLISAFLYKKGISDSIRIFDQQTKSLISVVAKVQDDSILNEIVHNQKIGDQGYIVVGSIDGTFLMHPNTKYVGKTYSTFDFYPKLKDCKEGKFIDYTWQGYSKRMYAVQVRDRLIIANYTYTEVEHIAFTNLIMTVIGLLLASIVISALAYMLIGHTLGVLKEVEKKLQEIACGELQGEIKISTLDEIGQVIFYINRFIFALKQIVQNVQMLSEDVAASSDELSSTSQTVATNIQIQATSAEEINATVEQMSAGMGLIQRSTTEQTLKINEFIETVDEMNVSVSQLNSAINVALTGVRTATSKIHLGEESLNLMSKDMSNILKRSSEMRNVLEIISDIADKVNLLSLNAKIESARAKEAGLGFAVVANEIGKLSDMTAKSVQEISDIIISNDKEIKSAIGTTNNSVEIFKDITKSVKDVSDCIIIISDQMQTQMLINGKFEAESKLIRDGAEQIEHAVREAQIGLDEITRSVSSINEAGQTNAGGAEETSCNAENLNKKAEDMAEAIGFFKIEGR